MSQSNLASNRVIDGFPAAPKACKAVANSFFSCFTEKGKKENSEDREAGNSAFPSSTFKLRNTLLGL